MSLETSYPPTLVLDGPVFNDELSSPPQHLRQKHGVKSLRLIPTKSAASGVHAIYFKAEHRQWALVRLATRYRGLFEIQLQRGMSGERQLLQQGFQSTDLEFLFDIIPRPPESYSPIVYDMLWLGATYPEYRLLTAQLVTKNEFVPRNLLEASDGLSVHDAGFFTRFLRSHFIMESGSRNTHPRTRSSGSKSGLNIQLDASYTVTPDGRDALRGIVSEYERIFDRRAFEPLLINPDLDPYEHLRAYTADEDAAPGSVTLPELEEDDGILGEIASSFAPLDETVEPEADPESRVVQSETGGKESEPESAQPEPAHGTHATSGPIPDVSSTAASAANDSAEHSREVGEDSPDSAESKIGEFTEEEILTATVAAGQAITASTLVQTVKVKQAVWDAVDLGDRRRGELWNAVESLLLEMDAVCGRRGGHMWAAAEFQD